METTGRRTISRVKCKRSRRKHMRLVKAILTPKFGAKSKRTSSQS